jgi:hypothetical protein
LKERREGQKWTSHIISSLAVAVVHFMDVTTGKMVGDVMRLTVEAVEISLSPMGTLTERKLAFIDSNHDLYLTPILVS